MCGGSGKFKMVKWKFRKNLAFNVITAVVLLIVFFGVVVSFIGYISFTESLTREYVDSAYHNAYTATSLLDGGKPFDPTKKTDPNVTLSAEERQIGGLGIFMTKKMMDDVNYEYIDGKNILTLKKGIE